MSEALEKLRLQLMAFPCMLVSELSGLRIANSPSTAAATIPRNEAKSKTAGFGLPFFVFNRSNV